MSCRGVIVRCVPQAQAQERTSPAVARHLRAQISELQGRRPMIHIDSQYALDDWKL